MRTVNSVLKTFSKAVKHLDIIIAAKGALIDGNIGAVARLVEERDAHVIELRRAEAVSKKIADLIS